MILTLFVIFNLCIIIVTGDLTVFRGPSRFSSQHDLYTRRQLLCISNNPKDAIIWNTDLTYLQWASPNILEMSEFSNDPKVIFHDCGVSIDLERCFSKWKQYNGSMWKLTRSTDVPMGPVYDSRWEQFSDYTSDKYRYIHDFLSDNTALIFSLRGSNNAHIYLSKHGYYPDVVFTIGDWKTNFTTIRDCFTSLISSSNPSESSCSPINSAYNHQYLSPYEWKTFVLTWNTISVQLFDPNRLILSYNTGDKNKYKVHFRSSDYEMLFRFHNYSYILATKPGAVLRSPPLMIRNSEKICIDIMVGLCRQCKLIVNLIDGSEKRQWIKTIVRSKLYKNIEHNLTMWEHERININVAVYSRPIALELVAESSISTYYPGDHWALSKFEECLPNGTSKRIKLISEVDCDNCPWPPVKCQSFSSTNLSTEVVDANLNVSMPPSDLQYCQNFTIGPQCETKCDLYFKDNCTSVTMCNQNRCFCTSGYNGSDCKNKCSQGSYGYGCVKKCTNCTDENCDPYSGVCKTGCKPIAKGGVVLAPPYCNIVLEDNNKHYLYWALPLFLLLAVMIGGALYYYFKRRNQSNIGHVRSFKMSALAIEAIPP